MLPSSTEYLIHTLERAGFEAYAVGGCVRDMLRGVAAHDVDITTNALPNDVIKIFSDCVVIPTGIQHGTVTVVYDGLHYEITTYRTDGTYSDTRHPDRVSFTSSLEDDLKRRDFTVNAMAYHPTRGLVDIFNGKQDLQRRILRCVGDPDTRFKEDALRIARLVRFMSVLDFETADDTAQAAHRLCHTLSAVAAERKQAELTKLLLGDGFLKVATDFSDVLCEIVPALYETIGFEQHNPHHEFSVYEHSVRTVAAAQKSITLRLAALLHDVGKPHCYSEDENGIGHFYGHTKHSCEIAKQALDELRFDNTTKNRVLTLIEHHDLQIEPNERFIKRWMSKLGVDQFEQLVRLQQADASGRTSSAVLPEVSNILQIYSNILENSVCISLSNLAINGDTLLSLGILPGPYIGLILRSLLDDVLDGNCENTEQALIKRIQERWM